MKNGKSENLMMKSRNILKLKLENQYKRTVKLLKGSLSSMFVVVSKSSGDELMSCMPVFFAFILCEANQLTES
jgi:hypothetical protein